MKKAVSHFYPLCCIIFFAIIILNIQTSRAQNYTFSQAIKLGESINSEAEESMPIISPDGNKIFFVRTLHENNTGGKYSGQDIWISVKNEFNDVITALQ